jgi:DNA ligase-1
MKRFTALYMALDATTKTNQKIGAMRDYFAGASPGDAAWALFFLSGRRPKRLLSSALLRHWAGELAGIPEWLLVEAYGAVGDSAETVTLLLGPGTSTSDKSLQEWVEGRVLPLYTLDEEAQRSAVISYWQELDESGRFVFNKLLTGSFRVGVSQRLLVRALAEVAARQAPVPDEVIAHRLMGSWEPTADFYLRLLAAEVEDADVSRPYPFFLAYPLEDEPETLGDVAEWQAEWKWDGIRAQLIRRGGQTFLWSRGEELVTDRYPEVVGAAAGLPDGTVLDGELLPWSDDGVMPFAQLQRRIGRKSLSRKMLQEVPVVLLTYDLLEWNGEDWRARPLAARRAQLEALLLPLASPQLPLSAIVAAGTWDDLTSARAGSRERNVEGLMLKRRSSAYQVGRKRGDWWKWKIEPHTIDAVMIYAQRGSGRRASLYSDYTFAVWDNGELVPFTKAYSGLTDAEMRQVDAFVRRNTRERFGPVRSVTPELVFELGFEAIQRSNRHKSGVAVRFPRILRWRHDKRIEEADTLGTLKAMLPPEDAPGAGMMPAAASPENTPDDA